MKNAKAKGSRNERRTIKLLESQGYYCTKSGGSLGMWDIIAFNRNHIRLIQSKTNRPPPKCEMDTMSSFSIYPPGTTKELWIWKDHQRSPEVIPISTKLV